MIRNRVWQVAAVAASLVLVAGGLRFWQSRRTVAVPPAPQIAAKAALPPALSVFQLQAPLIRPPAASDPLSRGSAQPGPSDDLALAFASLSRGDFADAQRRLRALIRRQPPSATAHFYLGVTELFLEHDREATAALERARRLANDDADLEREAMWYLALAYQRTGLIERAKDTLEVLCRGQGGRVAQACSGIRELSGPVTLSGVVTGPGGVPLAGARVAELGMRIGRDFSLSFPTEISTTTDASGRYSITGVRTPLLRVFKDGYFTTGTGITRITEDTQLDFSMRPWEFISIGEAVHGTIEPGDPACGDPDTGCQLFAVRAPADGTLEVELSSPSERAVAPLPGQKVLLNWDLYVETPAGDTYGPPTGGSFPLRLAISAERGATYQISVLSFTGRHGEFELTTRLR